MSAIMASCYKEVPHMAWKELWMNLFGRTEWLGINMGFWVGIGVVLLVVVAMNVVFWSMKPRHPRNTKSAKSA